ncbi:concanavalin A-like lectin/glucanase domain-containing protein [Chaetomidium leptoderma]|uniref:Concanavalin A-like lectin/glucanase domain-containing protein n=1 Tax=Chaetomidium leptoderma TaxID=669021 RepID=A0AAN6VUM1_9PEZI|nr:concanavalin A-like lectin/glucanase domain-containing protein [Chaetomidium leptoderma]
MKPTTLLTLLLTTSASAATLPRNANPPQQHQQQQRQQHRLALLHTLTPAPAASQFRLLAATTESVKGGAILTTDQPFASAQGTFRVPDAKVPTTGPTANNPVGVYAASFWVGIDSARPTTTTTTGGPSADACGGGLALRAGVDVFYDGTFGGPQTPFAWYQFAPAMGSEKGFEGFAVAAGDLVRFTLEAGSGGGGGDDDKKEVVVVAENFGGNVTCANGATPVVSVRQVLPASTTAGGARLCAKEAAWMVEDFPLAGLPDFPVALANFTSVAFGGAGVTLADGSKKDVTGTEVLDVRLQQQGGRLTSCEVVDGKKVKCDRVVGDN